MKNLSNGELHEIFNFIDDCYLDFIIKYSEYNYLW